MAFTKPKMNENTESVSNTALLGFEEVGSPYLVRFIVQEHRDYSVLVQSFTLNITYEGGNLQKF